MTATTAKIEEAKYFSISKLARLMGMSWETIKRRLIDVEPAAMQNGSPVYDFRAAMDAIYKQQEATEKKDPADYSPTDQNQYYNAQNKRLDYEIRLKQLIPINDVQQALADINKKTAMAFNTLADVLERDAGLTPEQLIVIERVCDDVRQTLYDDITTSE